MLRPLMLWHIDRVLRALSEAFHRAPRWYCGAGEAAALDAAPSSALRFHRGPGTRTACSRLRASGGASAGDGVAASLGATNIPAAAEINSFSTTR